MYLLFHFHWSSISRLKGGDWDNNGSAVTACVINTSFQFCLCLNLLLMFWPYIWRLQQKCFLCPEGPLMKHAVLCNKSKCIDLQLFSIERAVSGIDLNCCRQTLHLSLTQAHKSAHIMHIYEHACTYLYPLGYFCCCKGGFWRDCRVAQLIWIEWVIK